MVLPDYSKSLAELTSLPIGATRSRTNFLGRQGHAWLTTPLVKLSAEEVRQLMTSEYKCYLLVPLAVGHLELDPCLFGLLKIVLDYKDFPWLEDPTLVRRLRRIIDSALSDLNEWDGTAEIVSEANQHERVMMESWAFFERRLSKVE